MASIERFISAQERDYATALQEVKNGRKQGHWIWYIFPQIAGLGASSTSQYYAIANMTEAKEYLANPILRARLTEISTALLELSTDNAESVFGYLDAMKVRSSMTLFKHADEGCEIWNAVLKKFFGGQEDWRTLSLIEK